MVQFADSYIVFDLHRNKNSSWESVNIIKSNPFYSGLQNLKVIYQEELLI